MLLSSVAVHEKKAHLDVVNYSNAFGFEWSKLVESHCHIALHILRMLLGIAHFKKPSEHYENCEV